VHVLTEDGIVIAAVSGEIDLSNAARLTGNITGAVTNEATALIVDLSDVTFMDSAGVRMLLELAKRLEWRDQALRLMVPADSLIRKVLTVSGVDGVVTVDDSVESARAHLAHRTGGAAD